MTTPFTLLIERARAVRIEDEIARRGIKLRGNGIDRCGPCPKCGGTDRFAIHIGKQVFNCRGCGAKGDVIDLVRHIDRCDVAKAVYLLTGEPTPNTTGNGLAKAIAKKKAKLSVVPPAPPEVVKEQPKEQPKPSVDFIYQDEHGNPYLRVHKYWNAAEGKNGYAQQHLDGQQWVNGKPSGDKVPYRLPQLIAAPLATPIYFCEGEKDVESLVKLGLVATTMSEGAGAPWAPAATKWFEGRPVIILPDADVPGRAHALKVAKALTRYCRFDPRGRLISRAG